MAAPKNPMMSFSKPKKSSMRSAKSCVSGGRKKGGSMKSARSCK